MVIFACTVVPFEYKINTCSGGEEGSGRQAPSIHQNDGKVSSFVRLINILMWGTDGGKIVMPKDSASDANIYLTIRWVGWLVGYWCEDKHIKGFQISHSTGCLKNFPHQYSSYLMSLEKKKAS